MPAETRSNLAASHSPIVFGFLILLSAFLSGEVGNEQSAFVPGFLRSSAPLYWFAGFAYGALLALWLSLRGEMRTGRLFIFILASTAYFLAVEFVFAFPLAPAASLASIVLAGGLGALLLSAGYSYTIERLSRKNYAALCGLGLVGGFFFNFLVANMDATNTFFPERISVVLGYLAWQGPIAWYLAGRSPASTW